MSVSRRRFLQNSALVAAAACAAPLRAWNDKPENKPGNKPLAESGVFPHAGSTHALSRQAFEGAVGSAFKVSPVSGNGNAVWMRLLSVTDLPPLRPVDTGAMAVPPPKSTSPTVTTAGFMLSFSGPGLHLKQATYAFEHQGLGKFALFIVPAGPGRDVYSALFNHLETTNTKPHH